MAEARRTFFSVSARGCEHPISPIIPALIPVLPTPSVISATIPRAISAAYEVSGNIRFYTIGKDEIRAWTLPDGSTAHDAAAKVHTDMARGFIRAKTIAFDDLNSEGSEKSAKEKGLVRLEGKSYTVRDGDVIEFHFSK